MNRLDCFNLAAARILQQLLEVFPVPIDLDTQQLQEAFEVDFKEHGFASHDRLALWTLLFLGEEGFVRMPPRQLAPIFYGCVLTGKAIAALNREFIPQPPRPPGLPSPPNPWPQPPLV